MTKEMMISVESGQDNVFKDLNFDDQEAMNLKVRADLMLDLRAHIEAQRWTQQEAADRLEETQTQISSLMNGEISQFSVDELIELLGKAGMDVRVEVVPKAA